MFSRMSDTKRVHTESTEYETEYRSTIQPRTAQHRTSSSRQYSSGSAGGGGGGRILKMVTEMGSSSVSGISPALAENAAQSILQATEKEKKEMQNLNDRLGNYIDRVKGLESQNRKLVADLDDVRGRWGKDTTAIKTEFAGNLMNARKLIDDGQRSKAEIEVQIGRLQEDLVEYRRRYVTQYLFLTAFY